jgi:organic radical activating enzyme
MKTYLVNKIFYTIQGEGPRFGTPQVFLRMSKCNLQCWFCDTEFETYVTMTAKEILGACNQAGSGKCKNLSLCGGEPAMQVDEELINTFKNDGWFISMETNGMFEFPQGIDYVVCSPKTKKVVASYIDELRFVVDSNTQLDNVDREVQTALKNVKQKRDTIVTLSPMFDMEEANTQNIERVKAIVRVYPHKYRMSIQTHKFIGIE